MDDASVVMLTRWQRVKPDLIGGSASILIVLVAFWPIAFGGRTFSTARTVAGVNGLSGFEDSPPADYQQYYHVDPGASAWVFEPWVEVNDRLYENGELPLWNPYQGAGSPQAANMQSAPFDPLLAPVNLNPTPLMWDLAILLAYCIGALGTYSLARLLTYRVTSALVSAAAFSMSGYFYVYSNNAFVRSFVYIPIVCLLVEIVVRSKGWRSVFGLGLVVAANIVAGMPEASFVVMGTGALYGLCRVFNVRREGRTARSLVRLAAGFAVGVMLAAPLILMLVDYLELAFHIHNASDGVGRYTNPLSQLMNLVAPFYRGAPYRDVLGAGFTGTRNWVGAAVPTLALVALSGRSVRQRTQVGVFGVIALVAFLKLYDFGLLDFTGGLPGVAMVNFVVFGTPALAFALAMMAGAGVEVMAARDLNGRRFALWLSAAGLLVAHVIGDDEVRQAISLATTPQVLRQVGVAAAAAALIAIVALISLRRSVAVIAGLIMVAELFSLMPYRMFAQRADPFREPTWLAAVNAQLASSPYSRVYGLDGKLYPNTAGALGLQDIRMLDALYIESYLVYVKAFLAPTVYDRFIGGPFYTNELNSADHILGNPMFDALAVKVLVGQGPAVTTSLLVDTLATIAPSATLQRAVIDIGGDARVVLYQQPVQEVVLPAPPPEATSLSFSYAVGPQAWPDPAADGVRFDVIGITEDESRFLLFSDEMVPKVDPVEPEWRSGEVELSSSGDRIVEVRLRTEARGTGASDASGWTDLRYGGPTDVASAALPRGLAFVDQINGTWIYENLDALPRAWVVHSVGVEADQHTVLAHLIATGTTKADGRVDIDRLDPRRDAVVESGDLAPFVETCDPAGDSVAIESYEANRVELTVETGCRGLLVLPDTYFPGWEATVNGDDAEILPTNVAFRGVLVDAGRSHVVFEFAPPGLRRGLVIAFFGLLVCPIAALIDRRRSRRGPRPATHGPAASEQTGVGPVSRRAVFLDRDGVLNRAFVRDGVPHPPATVDELEILPGVRDACERLRGAGFLMIVVTNQPDIARGSTTAEAVEELHERLRSEVTVDDIIVCPHDDVDACACRKPRPGMLVDAAQRWGIDLAASAIVGDRWRDIEAGRAAGIRTVFIDRGYAERLANEPDLVVGELADAVSWLLEGAVVDASGQH